MSRKTLNSADIGTIRITHTQSQPDFHQSIDRLETENYPLVSEILAKHIAFSINFTFKFIIKAYLKKKNLL